MPSQLGGFRFCTLLDVSLSNSSYVIASGPSLIHCSSFHESFIHSVFLFPSFRSYILFQKGFVILERPVLTVLLDLVSLSFKSSFFPFLYFSPK